MKKGLFISFEGCEGSGKTSIIKSIKELLEDKGYNVICTREPGGIKIAEEIRGILLDKENTEMDSITEAFLFAASRRQHLVEKIIPKLENKFIVLCDRFIDSSLAYQALARGNDYDLVYSINKAVIGEYMPNLTIFVDCRPSVGLNRINRNKMREINRLDLEALSFHEKVYDAYKLIMEKEAPRIKSVNGELLLDAVVAESMELIENLINEHQSN